MVTMQWVVYGPSLPDDHYQDNGGAVVDVHSSMHPITIITITAEDEKEARRVFRLMAEDWRHWGGRTVYDDGRRIDNIGGVTNE